MKNKRKGKMFLFSASNTFIVETTIDKIYLKTSSVDVDPTLNKFSNSDVYREAEPNETSIASLQYGKIVYVKDEDFDDMILGNRANRNTRIFKVISIGHKNDKLNKFKAKLRLLKKRKHNGKSKG